MATIRGETAGENDIFTSASKRFVERRNALREAHLRFVVKNAFSFQLAVDCPSARPDDHGHVSAREGRRE